MNWTWLSDLARRFTGRPTTGQRTTCGCGHDESAHVHWRPGADCGACGAALCPRFDPVDLHAVCADAQLVEAVLADDEEHARLLADEPFVAALFALAAVGRRA